MRTSAYLSSEAEKRLLHFKGENLVRADKIQKPEGSRVEQADTKTTLEKPQDAPAKQKEAQENTKSKLDGMKKFFTTISNTLKMLFGNLNRKEADSEKGFGSNQKNGLSGQGERNPEQHFSLNLERPYQNDAVRNFVRLLSKFYSDTMAVETKFADLAIKVNNELTKLSPEEQDTLVDPTTKYLNNDYVTRIAGFNPQEEVKKYPKVEELNAQFQKLSEQDQIAIQDDQKGFSALGTFNKAFAVDAKTVVALEQGKLMLRPANQGRFPVIPERKQRNAELPADKMKLISDMNAKMQKNGQSRRYTPNADGTITITNIDSDMRDRLITGLKEGGNNPQINGASLRFTPDEEWWKAMKKLTPFSGFHYTVDEYAEGSDPTKPVYSQN